VILVDEGDELKGVGSDPLYVDGKVKTKLVRLRKGEDSVPVSIFDAAEKTPNIVLHPERKLFERAWIIC
jgi:hypothetical protein